MLSDQMLLPPTNAVMEYAQEMMDLAVAKNCGQWKFIVCKFGFLSVESVDRCGTNIVIKDR